jgi:hypothetical protein
MRRRLNSLHDGPRVDLSDAPEWRIKKRQPRQFWPERRVQYAFVRLHSADLLYRIDRLYSGYRVATSTVGGAATSLTFTLIV